MVNKYDDDVSAGAEKINLPACMVCRCRHRGYNCGMTKYRKGPQKSITQDNKGPMKNCKGTLWDRLQEIGTN